MADINITVSHTIKMDDACVATASSLSFVGARDLDLVAGRVTIRITTEPVGQDNALSGELTMGPKRVQLVRALPSLTSQRDIDQSDGKLRISDKKFRISRGDLKFIPSLGDQVEATQTFEILAVDDVTQTTSVVIWCRG